MSLRNEQYRSLAMVRDLMHDIIIGKYKASKPGLVRHEAARAMRHFPPLENTGRPLFSNDEYGPDDPPRDAA